MAEIGTLKEAFAKDIDIHAVTASQMFGVPVAEVGTDLRRSAKMINYGIVYGIGAFGLAQRLGIPQADAPSATSSPISSSIRASAPTWTRPRPRRASKGYVTTLYGRRCYIPEINVKHPLAPRLRRARRDQRPDPGHGRRHHEARHDPHLARPQAPAPTSEPHAAPGPRRAGVRGAGGRGRADHQALIRGVMEQAAHLDGAAGGRCRPRPQLGRRALTCQGARGTVAALPFRPQPDHADRRSRRTSSARVSGMATAAGPAPSALTSRGPGDNVRPRMTPALESLAQRVLNRDRRALARAITLIESTPRRSSRARRRAARPPCCRATGKSVRLGITGVPGVGKSTFIERFGLSSDRARAARSRCWPSIPRPSAAAARSWATRRAWRSCRASPRAFIRPSPAGATLGGVARRTREAMLLVRGGRLRHGDRRDGRRRPVRDRGRRHGRHVHRAAAARPAATTCRASSAASSSLPT